jgi:hypothetical protein
MPGGPVYGSPMRPVGNPVQVPSFGLPGQPQPDPRLGGGTMPMMPGAGGLNNLLALRSLAPLR